MHSHRMMKATMPCRHLGGKRPECSSLIVTQTRQHRVHIIGEFSARQQRPAMAAGNVVHAAIFLRSVVQSYPTRKMRDRLCPRPIRMVLVPSDKAAIISRLCKYLIVPQPDRTAKQRFSGLNDWRMEHQIVKRRRHTPRTESMKQHSAVLSFVRMEFVESSVCFKTVRHHFGKIPPQSIQTLVTNRPRSQHKAIFSKEIDCIVRQNAKRPIFDRSADRMMKFAKVFRLHTFKIVQISMKIKVAFSR